MKTSLTLAVVAGSLLSGAALADNQVVTDLLRSYTAQGATESSAKRGQQLWLKTFRFDDEFSERSCASCHTQDLGADGKHVKTGKIIKAMSPSVNSERLTDSAKIEKWFKRNCKWTFGRECSAQEKSDFLLYISNQTRF